MRDRTVNRVESWDARPFSGGFATLRDMADASFSGVVVSGDAWLFMLNGRVVGIVDGDIDDFEDASGTMYEAPDPALPLLFSMQERGGTTQAKYYTNDTPLQEADRTLSDANFTGYVELSENVLSGDYYLVYYGGRALPVAFVGTSEELKTGDEAYDLATDEVGVYEVIKTPVNVTQVPGPSDDESESSGAAAGGAGAAGAAGAADDANGSGAADGADVSDTAPDTEDTGTASDAVGETAVDEAPETDVAIEDAESQAPKTDTETEAADDSVVESAEADAIEEPADQRTARPASGTSDESAGDAATDSATEAAAGAGAGTASGAEASANGGSSAESPSQPEDPDDSVFSEEEQWRQTKSIPSLSPSEREKRRQERSGDSGARRQQSSSGVSGGAAGSKQSGRAPESRQSASAGAESSTPDSTEQRAAEAGGVDERSDAARTSEPEASADAATGANSPTPNEPAKTENAEPSADVKARISELESRIEDLGSERDSLTSELESVREERDDLERRVRELEQALEEAGGEPAPGPALSPAEALAGTNLFVRYGSKGQPTLDELAGKNPDREAINKNLRIDHHTQFEAQDATVDGRSFQQFLKDSSSYRFVSWLVRDLPYEILDSGQRSGLADFYDVVPEIDRAELQGVVEVETDDGQERREFDIVLRDRMGNPLVVAELNDERDPVSGDEMEALVDSARVIGAGADDLGAAFYVTASFFEPNALENAGEATANGGILSRSDRMSYVKLARKQGFHLCLTEDRNETFHLTVPEL